MLPVNEKRTSENESIKTNQLLVTKEDILHDTFSISYEEENPFAIGNWIDGDSLAPPCQAELDVVESIINLASLSKSSILCDLGCGDGRIPIYASYMYGCQSIGCEIEDKLIEQFRMKIKKLQLEDLVTVVHGDLQKCNLTLPTVISLYLLPEAIELIKLSLIDFLNRKNTGLSPVETLYCGFNKNVTLYKYDYTSLPI